MAKVVAEIGCNHKGDLPIAKQMIETAAKLCNADYVKFQKRCNKTLLSEEQYRSPHPVPSNSYGATYGEHREYLEFDLDQHKQLGDWCEEFGTKYACSAWEVVSAKQIAKLKPDYIKVPSACNLNFELLGWLAQNFLGDIHISLGMTTKQEEEKILSFMDKEGATRRVVLYACTSGYPVPFEDVCLLEITRLKETWGKQVKDIAFSGHHLGIAVDVAALTLGAEWIERHFTLDRTWKGTDHAASLEPTGLMKLVRDLKNVKESISYKKHDLLEIEKEQRDKLKRIDT